MCTDGFRKVTCRAALWGPSPDLPSSVARCTSCCRRLHRKHKNTTNFLLTYLVHSTRETSTRISFRADSSLGPSESCCRSKSSDPASPTKVAPKQLGPACTQQPANWVGWYYLPRCASTTQGRDTTPDLKLAALFQSGPPTCANCSPLSTMDMHATMSTSECSSRALL